MKFNKKYVISSLILIGAIVISVISTYSVKGNADEQTLADVKAELQAEIDSKIAESEEKDKKIEELNSKVSEQENTINQLNSSIQSLNEGLNNTNVALDNAKQVQKQDKVEVTNHSDTGDANLQKQVDTVKEKQNQPTKTDASGECSPEPVKGND